MSRIMTKYLDSGVTGLPYLLHLLDFPHPANIFCFLNSNIIYLGKDTILEILWDLLFITIWIMSTLKSIICVSKSAVTDSIRYIRGDRRYFYRQSHLQWSNDFYYRGNIIDIIVGIPSYIFLINHTLNVFESSLASKLKVAREFRCMFCNSETKTAETIRNW